jgi:DNA-binding MarR family transcriptional regulator
METNDEKFDLSLFLPYRLAVAAARVSRDFSAQYEAAFGLSVPEWRMLAHLSQENEVSIRDVHLRIDMDKSKASRASDRLKEIGLIVKVVSPLDRRLVCLSLTEKGRDTMERIIPIANRFQHELCVALGPDLMSFHNALNTILYRNEGKDRQSAVD